MTFAILKVKNQ